MGTNPTKDKRIKLIIMAVCSLMVVIFQIFYSHSISSHFSEHMKEQRKSSISKMVHLAYNKIKPVVDKVKTGEIEPNQARIMVSDIIRGMTYWDEFGENYIFMSTYEGIMLVQPFEPEKEGTSQWDFKDARGSYAIRELVNAARKEPAGSFVTYHYYPPNKTEAEEKLSFVIGIPEIEAYIGTGMYVESNYYELEKVLENQRYGDIGLTLFILVTMMLYFSQLLKSNSMLTKEIRSRESAEEKLHNQYKELQCAQEELQENHDELTAMHEELTATEEELREQYEELQQAQSEIKRMAYFDYLTGLPNRVFIANELKSKLSEASLESCAGAVFFIDIDNFKFINDTFGHSYGDRVLIEVSARLKSLSKGEFTVARISGDEFVVVQNLYNDETKVKELAQRILELFKETVSVDRNSFHVTCSIGIALYPEHGSTTEEILKNADLAMYKAKNTGKNRYLLYEHSMGADLVDRIETENELRNAFENNEFVLFYQPNYNAQKGIISGFEALIRWNSPAYGMVSPARFIGIAEEMGLINKIGKWVIEKSFEFAGTLQNKGMCISCNVSPIQLIQSSFVDDVIEAFDRHDLKRGSVALEITESSLVESFKEITEKLERLRNKGILIYLDDFGTGYSSLNYLRRLPIDIVKIDKSFVDGIVSGGIETRIVRTMVSLAHEIGLEVVAEGVETSEQLQYLKECDCNYVQGYLISKPVPESNTAEFV